MDKVRKLLLVDDDMGVLNALKRRLRQLENGYHHRVRCAQSAGAVSAAPV